MPNEVEIINQIEPPVATQIKAQPVIVRDAKVVAGELKQRVQDKQDARKTEAALPKSFEPEVIERVNEAAKQVAGTEQPPLDIKNIPLLNESPWLLGGPDSIAQQAALRQFERLVRDKDELGLYDMYAREGITFTFMDKVYIESTLLHDRYNQQQAKEKLEAEAAAAAEAQYVAVKEHEKVALETIMPVVSEVVPSQESVPVLEPGAIEDLGRLDTADSVLFPSLTTALILFTFLLTIYQLYRYMKRMLGTKGGAVDYESFQSSASLYKRQPLVTGASKRVASRANQSDGFVGAAAQETFVFDSSEVGNFTQMENFEEYTGPALNNYINKQHQLAAQAQDAEDEEPGTSNNDVLQSLDRLMGNSTVSIREH